MRCTPKNEEILTNNIQTNKPYTESWKCSELVYELKMSFKDILIPIDKIDTQILYLQIMTAVWCNGLKLLHAMAPIMPDKLPIKYSLYKIFLSLAILIKLAK